MKKPIIGITPLFSDKINNMWMLPLYPNAIWHSGGVPVVLPLSQSKKEADELAKSLDGFLFPGGHDVDPSTYGEEKLPFCLSTSLQRDKFEKMLLESALEYKKPVLAICRSFKFMNAALGGSLYQDIEMQLKRNIEIKHLQEKPYDAPAHSVKILPGTPISNLVSQEEIMVNTIHHQTIKTLADRLRIAAVAPDGIIEAAYMPSEKFVVGVQWHPEYMFELDLFASRLFETFIKACE